MDMLTDDIVCTLAAFLDTHDLLNLALCSKRFGGKHDDEQDAELKPAAAAALPSCKRRKISCKQQHAQGRDWSLVEEAAKRRVDSAIKDDPRWRDSDLHDEVSEYSFKMRQSLSSSSSQTRDSWMAKDYRLHKFKTSLVFHRFAGNRAGYVDRNPCHIRSGETTSHMRGGRAEHDTWAVCQEIMTKGRHHVEITVTHEGVLKAGIVRPMDGWARTYSDDFVGSYHKFCKTERNKGNPAYGFRKGHRVHPLFGSKMTYWSNGVQCKEGDRLVMILDLESNKLMLYINGKQMTIRTDYRRPKGHFSFLLGSIYASW